MEKEKQIEEMARALRFDGKDCESTQCLLCHNSKHCFERKLAEEVISKGYRKASDVAEEIAEGIINEILPKHLYGHNEKALELSFAISNFISKITENEK